jgi:hypothetical protein
LIKKLLNHHSFKKLKTMENKVKDQLVTEKYAIYNSDCMLVMPTIADESIDLSVYSPPFAGLYNIQVAKRY